MSASQWLLVLPLLIPFITAIAGLVLHTRPAVERAVAVCGAFGLALTGFLLARQVAVHGPVALQVGGWSAPYGITLVADHLAAAMVAVSGFVAAAVVLYAAAVPDERSERFGYWPLAHCLLLGVCGAFLTGDLFSLYVWFEIMLIASFVLLALGGRRAQLEGALKYVVLNLASSALFLIAVGLLYGKTGTVNMADMAVRVASATPEEVRSLTAVASLLLVAFGIKAALFPLFFWLPASYHTPRVATSALFAGLLTKVGVYALIRVFTLIFRHDLAFTHGILLWVAGLTMVVGVIGAVAQKEIRRVLSFHIVSQIGYMIMGLALFTPLALAGAVFYVMHHIIVKTNLFLVGGAVAAAGGSGALSRLGGLAKAKPFLAVLFIIPALALAGLPPFSGFYAKLTLARAGLEAGAYTIVAVSLGVSLFTLLSMMKIWLAAFWRPAPEGAPAPTSPGIGRYAACIPLTAVSLYIGFFPESFAAFAVAAAEELMRPEIYISTVLGGVR